MARLKPVWTLLCTVFACFGTNEASSESRKYIVTGPSTATPGAPYSLSVQILDSPSPVAFLAFLEKDNHDNTGHRAYVRVTDIASATIDPGKVTTMTFQIPENVKDLVISQYENYRIHVRGTGGLQIEETYPVTVNKNVATIFIQLAKASYEPGNRVEFQTFALNNLDLTPYPGDYKVELWPPSSRVALKTWGVPQGSNISTMFFDLDDHTALGTWTLKGVDNSGMARSATEIFEVGAVEKRFQQGLQNTKTEPQTFDVKVQLPKSMNSSVDLVGSFEARYPGGEEVRGSADITIDGYTHQTKQFNGNATFTFPYNQLLTATTVTVKVREDDTDITSTGQSTVRVYPRDVKIEFTEQTSAVFKPKIPFTAYLKISNHADEPLHIPADSVFSTVYVYGVGHYQRQAPSSSHYSYSSFSGTYPILAHKLTLPDYGLFSLDIDIPDDVTQVDLRVTFQGVQETLTLRRAEDTTEFIQISLLGDVAPVTETQPSIANFRVVSSQPLSDLTVEVVSRGQLVLGMSPPLRQQTTSGDLYSAEFSVTMTWAMTPVVDLVAYHPVMVQGRLDKIASDSIRINVEGLLENKVEVTSDKQHAQPGQEVTLHVQARAGSMVGVLVARDNSASVKLSTVVQSIQRGQAPLDKVMSTTQSNPISSFKFAGLHIIDGDSISSYVSTTNPVRQTGFFVGGEETKPDAFFLGTNTTGSDGQTSFAVTLPDTVGSWSVSAFAFDSSGHVGVYEQPLVIETIYDVYGDVSGADDVVSGEHVILTVNVRNTRDVESQVAITLKPGDNVALVQALPNAAMALSRTDQQQNITMPAKSTQQIFFAFTSQGVIQSATTSHLELTIESGDSKQMIPYDVTISPKGVESTFTTASFLDVSGHVTMDIPYVSAPNEAISGTTSTRVTVTDNFDDLMLPMALGEKRVTDWGTAWEAVLNFALPVFAARYHPELGSEITGRIERGYQGLLPFFKSCTSCELFNDFVHTIDYHWRELTALKLLNEARSYIEVDVQKMESTIGTYLLKHYNEHWFGYEYDEFRVNRQFSSYSPINAASVQEAIVSLAIQDITPLLGIPVKLHHQGWQTSYPSVNDPLALSYIALACFKYGNTTCATAAMSILVGLQDAASINTDVLFWDTNRNDNFSYYGDWLPGRHVVGSHDIITAANSLQVLTLSGQTTDADRVARWLMQQRRGSGLFKTPMDTIAATEALMLYNSKRQSHISSLSLGNSPSQHSGQMLRQGGMTNLTVNGHGKLYTQVDVTYHVTDDVGDASFEVVPVVLDESTHHFKLMICSRWLLTTKDSGATVQEVSVPSGFVADVKELTRNSAVVTYIRRNITTTSVYFRQMGSDSTCYTLSVDRLYPVAKIAPSFIVTRSVEHPENKDIVSYHPRRISESTVCDLCSACCP